MSEFAGFDLDRSTRRAWSRFQARLADHLAEMGDDDMLVIESEGAGDVEGAAPYVRFVGCGEGSMLRGEVSSNTYLAEQFELGEEGVAALAGLGWSLPTTDPPELAGDGSAHFHVDVPVTEADRLAVMAVKALRDIFGVAHPAFLDAGGLGTDPEAPDLPAGAETGAPEEPLAVMPQTAEHLRDLVDQALTPLFGSVPEHDDDGDIPVPWGSSLVFVRVDDDSPVVELFSMVVQGVTDAERAAFEVGVLNRDFAFMKFLLVGDRVMASILLPSRPFVPEHLRAMLTGMSARLDEIDDDLVARVGGRRAFESDEDDEEPHTVPVSTDHSGADTEGTALMTLLQLDVDASGTVDPELAAGICGFDQTLVLRLLGETGEQEVAWRSARDDALLAGDSEEAAACAHEMAAWERTTALLRRALRLIVERALGRVATGRSYAPVEPTTARPPRRAARRRFPRRPAEARVVHDAEGLARAFKVEGLVGLDDLLTTQSAFPVEVSDLTEQVEVSIAGESGKLEFPFTLGEFQALLHELEESAGVSDHVASDGDS